MLDLLVQFKSEILAVVYGDLFFSLLASCDLIRVDDS